VAATIVYVARETGQPVLAIARQPYALTLYTRWHLQQWERLRVFEHQSMQHHGASLNAFAMHEPKKLGELHDRFIAEHERRPRAMIQVVDASARVRDLVAAGRLTPVEPPTS
jgi:hypothetical protein